MFNFWKKPIKPLRPINILHAPPEGYVIVKRGGCSIEMLQAMDKALRFNTKGEVDYGSMGNAWRDAFEIFEARSEEALGWADIVIIKPNN